MSLHYSLVAIAACIALAASAVAQITIHVDPNDSIQAAIDQAVDGDEVVVAAGTYVEWIDLKGKAITLRSSDGPDWTIIDGNALRTVITCNSGEGPDTVIEGFKITNGDSSQGGGMIVKDSSPTVIGCDFEGNTADSGGGIYNENGNPTLIDCTFCGNTGAAVANTSSSPTLLNCVFVDNTDSGMSNYLESNPKLVGCVFSGNAPGGGMENSVRCSPVLIDCLFVGNVHATGVISSGGGMHNTFDCNPSLTNCRFIENSSSFSGGAIYASGGRPELNGCTFIGNSAIFGGAIAFEYTAPTLVNCQFLGNSASYSGGAINNVGSATSLYNCVFSGNTSSGKGGALHIYRWTLELFNCTFSGNAAVEKGGAISTRDHSVITMTSSILWGNTAPSGRDIFADGPTDLNISYSSGRDLSIGNGNIPAADPLLMDPNGPDGIAGTEDDDLRLQPGSPCIDAGFSVALSLEDLDGRQRIVDDPNTPDTGAGFPAVIDMGAYEFGARLVRDLDSDDDADIKDLATLQRLIVTQQALADLDRDGDVDGDDFVLCQQRITGPQPQP